MEKVDSIAVSCEGATTVPLDELKDLQGNLKDLTEENYVKLRNSMVKFGFSFPVFMWVDQDGTKWVVDAHQRLRTLRKMRSEEGIAVPDLPADYIHANNKTEAKEKLLLLNSQYGRMTQEGFDEFVTDIPLDDISDMLVLDNVMFEGQDEQKFENTNKELSPEELAKKLNMTCPKCGFQFEGDKGLTPDAQVPSQMESE